MRILIMSQLAGSNVHGMVYRNFALASELAKLGHEVTIVASAFAHTRKHQPEISGLDSSEVLQGVRFFWLPGLRYSTRSNLGRIGAMVLYTASAFVWIFRHVKRGSFDVVIGSSPFPTVIYPSYLAARLSRGKLVFDIRDLWPLTLKKLGGYSARHPFIVLMQCAEDFACRNSDLVLSVPRNSERYLISRGLQKSRFLHLPNAVGDELNPVSLESACRGILENARLEGKFIIGYAGAVGIANAMECLIRALPLVNDNVIVAVAGDGEGMESLRRLMHELKVADRVHFLGRISRTQVVDFLSLVDVGFVAARRSSLYRFGASPTKVNDYLLAELPVIYGVGDKGNAIAASGCGVEFRPDCEESCATAIELLYSYSPEFRENLGKQGRSWIVNNQRWSKLAVSVIESLSAKE